MKRLTLFILAASLLVSCSPQAFVTNLEMRYPSSSGMDLDGKSVSLVYLETDSPRDTVFSNAFADGFAQGIEKEYFNGNPDINVYGLSAPKDGTSLVCKDSLARLIMELDTDVVFVLDIPVFSEPAKGSMNYSAQVFGYDSMDPKDKVYRLSNKGITSSDYTSGTMFISDAQMAGLKTSSSLINSWKEEQFTFIYFYTDSRWTNALRYIEDNKWEDAMSIWMELAQDKSGTQLSCAAYDMAIGCYVMRQFELALEWLDLSDKTQPVSPAISLRKRIEARMK